jgi:hypothetical protein
MKMYGVLEAYVLAIGARRSGLLHCIQLYFLGNKTWYPLDRERLSRKMVTKGSVKFF